VRKFFLLRIGWCTPAILECGEAWFAASTCSTPTVVSRMPRGSTMRVRTRSTYEVFAATAAASPAAL
jgi:hypothetical protein